MRLDRFAVLWLVALLPGVPCGAQPKAQCASTRWNYGARLPGLLPPVVFTVTNKGTKPLVLRPQPCCDIIVTGAEKPVASGATCRLVVRAAHLREGLFRKTVRVLTNDPAAPELKLELEARGKSPVQLLPGDQLSFSLGEGIARAQRVQLRSNDESELRITSIRCSAPFVSCREVPPLLSEDTDPGRYRAVEVSVSSAAVESSFEAVVMLGTNCKRRPQVRLHVFGLSSRAVTAQPPRIDFDVLDEKEPNAHRLVMLSHAAGPFKILKVTTSDPRMQVKVHLDDSGIYGELMATFTPGDERGSFSGTITVQTDDPECRRLVIPYAGEAR
jgi:hypothetical protein